MDVTPTDHQFLDNRYHRYRLTISDRAYRLWWRAGSRSVEHTSTHCCIGNTMCVSVLVSMGCLQLLQISTRSSILCAYNYICQCSTAYE
jgi:hypothetical protein